MILVHGVAVASGVISKHGRVASFFYGVGGPTPENYRNSTLAVLFLLWKGIDCMLPVYVYISTERKEHAIGLGEV